MRTIKDYASIHNNIKEGVPYIFSFESGLYKAQDLTCTRAVGTNKFASVMQLSGSFSNGATGYFVLEIFKSRSKSYILYIQGS